MNGFLAPLSLVLLAQIEAPAPPPTWRGPTGPGSSLAGDGTALGGPQLDTKTPTAPPDLPEVETFFNWETPQVHPLDLSPDNKLLAAVNTADARVELFDTTGSALTPVDSIPVGLEPVSARFRTATELWVVNNLSDTISVIDTTTGAITRTLQTADEPNDVVFGGTPARAFVSCSHPDAVQVFAIDDLDAAPVKLPLLGCKPRAVEVSADGSEVYVAIFESGNATTILLGSTEQAGQGYLIDVVDESTGPHGGLNPPPNDGIDFSPPPDPELDFRRALRSSFGRMTRVNGSTTPTPIGLRWSAVPTPACRIAFRAGISTTTTSP